MQVDNGIKAAFYLVAPLADLDWPITLHSGPGLRLHHLPH